MKTNADTLYIIQKRISEGEHVHQDFKSEISDARKIAKSLSAFANTEGGRLLVEVKDNGKVAGVCSEEELYMVEAAQLYTAARKWNCIPIYIRWKERMCSKSA